MSIETRWYVEHRLSYTRLWGEVSEQDLKTMDAWLIACMDDSPALLVHHIIDTSDVTKPTSARQALQLKAPRHPRMGWSITIGANRNPIVRFLTALVISAARIRYRDVSTLDEALALLHTLDPTLPLSEKRSEKDEIAPDAGENTGINAG